MRKYGENKTTRIMMATVPHFTSGSGLRKFQADGIFFDRVYNAFLLYFTWTTSMSMWNEKESVWGLYFSICYFFSSKCNEKKTLDCNVSLQIYCTCITIELAVFLLPLLSVVCNISNYCFKHFTFIGFLDMPQIYTIWRVGFVLDNATK